ncbi:carbohydrate ABC transporter permease, partial [Streptomyces sp. URMC 126]
MRPRAGRSRPLRRAPRKHASRRLAADGALLVLAAGFALPLLWLVLASVDRDADLRVSAPEAVTAEHFSA